MTDMETIVFFMQIHHSIMMTFYTIHYQLYVKAVGLGYVPYK